MQCCYGCVVPAAAISCDDELREVAPVSFLCVKLVCEARLRAKCSCHGCGSSASVTVVEVQVSLSRCLPECFALTPRPAPPP